ncbi:MAG: hypothetical protein U0746_23035 [Gemmataceae bacterium]
MTKILLGALVAAMLTLTGIVAYSHFTAAPGIDAATCESCPASGGCKSCSSCCTLEMPAATASAGCPECEKAKTAATDEVKEQK